MTLYIVRDIDLKSAFIKFLKDKGYPQQSIILEMVVGGTISTRRGADIVIVEPESKDILAIIELKGGTNPSLIRQANRAMYELRKSLPTYSQNISIFIVSPSESSEENFIIHESRPFPNHTIAIERPKNTFPLFSELKFNAEIQEKMDQDLKETLIVDNAIKRTHILRGYSLAALAGLVVAIIGLSVAFYLSRYGGNYTKDEIPSQHGRAVDSIFVKNILEKYYNNTLNDSLVKFQSSIINSKDRKAVEKKIYMEVKNKISKDLERRLTDIEVMLSKEPDRTLSILEIKSQISEFKSLNESNNSLYNEKVENLKQKVDFLSTITLGLLTSFIVTLAGVIFTALIPTKKD